jgi:hypothetical protein
MTDLTFRRDTCGHYAATAPINGEADAFGARIVRDSTGWLATLTAYGLPLDAWHFATLAAAREWAARSYWAVEAVNA